MTDLFAPAAGHKTIDTNRQIGVFDPTDPDTVLEGSRRYGIPAAADHGKRTGYLVGADNTGYSPLMRAIEVDAFAAGTDFARQFGFAIPAGTQLTNPPLVNGRYQPAGEAFWATAWCDALSLAMQAQNGQLSTVWGVVVEPAQDEWNRRNPQQPAGPPAGPGQPGQPPVVPPPPSPPAITDAQATAAALAWWKLTWAGRSANGLWSALVTAGVATTPKGRDAISAAMKPLALAAAKAGVIDSQGRVVG